MHFAALFLAIVDPSRKSITSKAEIVQTVAVLVNKDVPSILQEITELRIIENVWDIKGIACIHNEWALVPPTMLEITISIFFKHPSGQRA